MTETDKSAQAEAEPVRLSPEVAADALTFLARTPIQGSEARAFLRVQAVLETIAMKAR